MRFLPGILLILSTILLIISTKAVCEVAESNILKSRSHFVKILCYQRGQFQLVEQDFRSSFITASSNILLNNILIDPDTFSELCDFDLEFAHPKYYYPYESSFYWFKDSKIHWCETETRRTVLNREIVLSSEEAMKR